MMRLPSLTCSSPVQRLVTAKTTPPAPRFGIDRQRNQLPDVHVPLTQQNTVCRDGQRVASDDLVKQLRQKLNRPNVDDMTRCGAAYLTGLRPLLPTLEDRLAFTEDLMARLYPFRIRGSAPNEVTSSVTSPHLDIYGSQRIATLGLLYEPTENIATDTGRPRLTDPWAAARAYGCKIKNLIESQFFRKENVPDWESRFTLVIEHYDQTQPGLLLVNNNPYRGGNLHSATRSKIVDPEKPAERTIHRFWALAFWNGFD